MELKVINTSGQPTGETIQLADSVFNIEPNDHAIYLDVRLLQANQRQGTHKVKSRGEVRGSTKKPWRQKGTGGARSGHKRSPLWRHGGTVHGPTPRDYGFKLNKKVRDLARKSALSYKAQANSISVVDGVKFTEVKTKSFQTLLDGLKLSDKKVLFVTPDYDINFFQSGRNLQKVSIVHASQLNTLDLVNTDLVVLLKPAVSVLADRLS